MNGFINHFMMKGTLKNVTTGGGVTSFEPNRDKIQDLRRMSLTTTVRF